MDAIALEAGSMISASLFGGLARSGALPFDVSLYESVIRASGRGVEASLAAFHGALNYEPQIEDQRDPAKTKKNSVQGPAHLVSKWNDLHARVATLPAQSQEMAQAGLIKVVDYQDIE
ncbi:hypothetical protein N9850_14320, partial [Granulosicoccus sp.]|nr:hypothetical protein [Granulosicoccus sp.]